MTTANTSPTPVFRTIDVATDVTITLGEPLSEQAMALVEQVGPQRFKLKPGTYERAKEIEIQLGVGAAVQQMDFVYAADANYHEMVAKYEAELGPPTSRHGGGGDEVTVWQDDNTEFRLVHGASGIRSFLRDRAPTSAAANS